MLSNRSVDEVMARGRRPLPDGRGSGPRVGAAGVAARGRGGEDRSLTVAARYRGSVPAVSRRRRPLPDGRGSVSAGRWLRERGRA